MNRALRKFTTWAAGGADRATNRPLIAGYKRAVTPAVVLAAVALLSIAFFVYGFYFSILAPARIMPFTIPIALLGGLVVWCLPHGAYAPSRALEPLYFAFFAALILWPNYLAIALSSLPWVTMLRLFVVPLILVMLICISVSPEFRRKLREVLATDKPMVRLMLALVALQTFSLVLSIDRDTSMNRYLIAQMNWTAIFFASVIVFARRGFAEHWARMLIAMLTVLCVVGIWEANIQSVPWAGHVPPIFKVDDEAVIRILSGAARAATKIHRVAATATTPLGFAEILGLAVPFAIHLAIQRYHIVVRLWAAAFIPISVYVIILTDSRLGLVAALGSVIIYLLIWGFIRWRSNPTGLIGPALVLTYPLLFVAFVAATFFVGRLRAQIWGDGSQAASDNARMDQWAMAIPKVLRNPLGYGIGNGGRALGYTNQVGISTIDSYYISILLEIGVFGFIVYYGLMLRAAWIGAVTVVNYQNDQEIRMLTPISVALVNFIVVKTVLSQEANHPFIFMMLGATLALTYRARKLTMSNAEAANVK